jgi:tyrosine aminotransferase
VKYSGYVHSSGSASARHAIAKYTDDDLNEHDVFLASGCAGALDLAISVLVDPNEVILVPNPGFPLYACLCNSKSIIPITYDLLPNQDWQVDLDQLEKLIVQLHSENKVVKSIIVNNPSNPCGSVYSLQHLQDIVQLMKKYQIVIIADEIYGHLVYPSSKNPFIPIAKIDRSVPTLSVNGIAKEFLVPGWRCGWVIVHDHGSDKLREIREGLTSLATLILSCNSLVDHALPHVLSLTNEIQVFHNELNSMMETHCKFLCNELGNIPGLKITSVPLSTFYVMVQLDALHFHPRFLLNEEQSGASTSVVAQKVDDVMFTKELLWDENVMVVPGSALGAPSFIRIVFCAPLEILKEATHRIKDFCERNGR